ncbi:MAG: hypothetical protein HFG26_09170 [Provencibacterium sp.]|jgi:hypothetical protein|nr:hypothetical protein [Provencibacterium sp.]
MIEIEQENEMFLFENGCFYMDDCSFILPDGFYLEQGDSFNKSIQAKTPDKKATIIWQVTDSEREIGAGLEMFLRSEPELSALSEVMPLTVNNLSGYQVYCKAEVTEIYEARFSLKKDRVLTFIVESSEQDIFDLVATPIIQRALNGLFAV